MELIGWVATNNAYHSAMGDVFQNGNTVVIAFNDSALRREYATEAEAERDMWASFGFVIHWNADAPEWAI